MSGRQAADLIDCALAGAAAFAQQCRREISHRGKAEIWTIRHPQGGFRRFEIIDKGTRIATADGAEQVTARRTGASLEVKVGQDRYLFPVAP